MQGHAPSASAPRQSPFLVEESSWLNFFMNVYSNHLPIHVVLTVCLLAAAFIFASPLSLIVTIPSVYSIAKVSTSHKIQNFSGPVGIYVH